MIQLYRINTETQTTTIHCTFNICCKQCGKLAITGGYYSLNSYNICVGYVGCGIPSARCFLAGQRRDGIFFEIFKVTAATQGVKIVNECDTHTEMSIQTKQIKRFCPILIVGVKMAITVALTVPRVIDAVDTTFNRDRNHVCHTITCNGVVSAEGSTAFGSNTNASGDRSTAFGYNTTASGWSVSTAFGAYTIASGAFSTAMGSSNVAAGDWSTAMGYQTVADGTYATAIGAGSSASGQASIAGGCEAAAPGSFSISLGFYTNTSGDYATSFGDNTSARGSFATSMGLNTVAEGMISTVMGFNVMSTKRETLVNSGPIHGKKLGFMADERLVSNVRATDSSASLRAVRALQVVSFAPSTNYCRHQNRSAADCASSRTVGLLGQQVREVLPDAVTSASSLTLAESTGAAEIPTDLPTIQSVAKSRPTLEHIDEVQSLDVATLIAHLVGAVQAQARQIDKLQDMVQHLSSQLSSQD